MGSKVMSTAQRVLDSIRRIVRLLREGSRASEDRVGLSAAQLFVLQKLDPARPLSLTELAARTLTHQSSVSVVVSKLRAQGLVRRAASSTDARRVEISLTAQGRALLERSPEAPPQDRLIAGLVLIGAQRRRRLAAGLRELVEAMALPEEPPAMFFEGQPPRARRQGGGRRASRS
jgi:DNA-binding MarR family transcriptional regulator